MTCRIRLVSGTNERRSEIVTRRVAITVGVQTCNLKRLGCSTRAGGVRIASRFLVPPPKFAEVRFLCCAS